MDTISFDPADFFGFGDVPFHQHLGLTFTHTEENDGVAIVGLPPSPAITGADDEQSPAAAYAVCEVAAALTACYALLRHAPPERLVEDLKPVMLARRARFRASRALHGAIEARSRFGSEPAAIIQRLIDQRKAQVEIHVQVIDAEGDVGARGSFDFYLRVMSTARLNAMTAAMAKQSEGAI